MSYSIQRATSDGTLSTVVLGIQYLQRTDVYMRIGGEEIPQVGGAYGYTWYFQDANTIKITPVVPTGIEVLIYRKTSAAGMYNVFSQNAQFDEATIDENNQQLLYIGQEYLEQGLPGAGVESLEFVREDASALYYRVALTDGSFTPEFAIPKQPIANFYNVGTFATGYNSLQTGEETLTYNNQEYSWAGALPKLVLAGSTPTPLGANAWIDRTDTMLRGELIAGGSTIAQIAALRTELTAAGSTPTQVGALRTDLAASGSTVSIAGLDAVKVKDAADAVRAVTINAGSGTQTASAAQIGSSILCTVAIGMIMPTIASLGGVTGRYRIMAGSNPITLTRIDGLSFIVRGTTVTSVTIPAGSDCYVAYSATSVYVYGLATYETIVKSYCLVNALGTGAPNELVSAALPANLAINTRYVLANPFGINVPVSGWAEIYYNSRWAKAGFVFDSGVSGGYGVAMDYVQGEGIIIQTGTKSVISSSSSSGGGHGITTSAVITSAPCRVFIQKLGA